MTPSVAGAQVQSNRWDMTVKFDDLGEQSITVAAVDRYDTNVYTLIVNVYDAKPLLIQKAEFWRRWLKSWRIIS